MNRNKIQVCGMQTWSGIHTECCVPIFVLCTKNVKRTSRSFMQHDASCHIQHSRCPLGGDNDNNSKKYRVFQLYKLPNHLIINQRWVWWSQWPVLQQWESNARYIRCYCVTNHTTLHLHLPPTNKKLASICPPSHKKLKSKPNILQTELYGHLTRERPW